LRAQLKQADILIAAIGQPQFVKGEWLKPGVVVIDVGTNFIPGARRRDPPVLASDRPHRCDEEVGAAPRWRRRL
jgi:methylenetetrahydrofolate dehydrogenase (NADP+)/methenyltetrahydrofolate cyclohydrolase/formyltetrahydrofolate synthetase